MILILCEVFQAKKKNQLAPDFSTATFGVRKLVYTVYRAIEDVVHKHFISIKLLFTYDGNRKMSLKTNIKRIQEM